MGVPHGRLLTVIVLSEGLRIWLSGLTMLVPFCQVRVTMHVHVVFRFLHSWHLYFPRPFLTVCCLTGRDEGLGAMGVYWVSVVAWGCWA